MVGLEALVRVCGAHTVFFVLATVIAAIVFLLLRYLTVNRAGEQFRGRREPVRTVPARVVSKRSGAGVQGEIAMACYFATFEEPSGVTREIRMYHSDFAKLREGDVGALTYQGVWHIRFRPDARGARRTATPLRSRKPSARQDAQAQ